MNGLNCYSLFSNKGLLYKQGIAALLAIGMITLLPDGANAQQAGYDTTYYTSYTNLITSRFYFSKKYTSLTLKGKDAAGNLQYRPNTTLNMGIGASYGWFTLNLAFGFPFLNQGQDSKGKTKYLDLQSHIYSRKYSIDLLGEFYRGYYLYPHGTARPGAEGWYQRPDMKVMHLGVAAYRIMNWKKFSFRAAMLQNEWQKKSAGSPLIGAEIYYGKIRGDSALVPAMLEDDFDQQNVNAIRYMNISPGLGYAYTLVIDRHFFITGSATGNLAVSFLREQETNTSDTRVSVIPGLSYKAAAGYNSTRWGVSMLWVHNTLETKGAGKYQVNTGNPRLNMVYRFMPNARLRKKLKLFQAD